MKCLLCTVAMWRAFWPGAGGQEAAIIDKWSESGDVHLSVCVPKHRDPASGQPALRPQKWDFSLVGSLPLHFPSVHTHVAPNLSEQISFPVQEILRDDLPVTKQACVLLVIFYCVWILHVPFTGKRLLLLPVSLRRVLKLHEKVSLLL